MSPVRVLVVSHTGELGGAELALLRLCAVLGPQVRVRVLLFADGELRHRLQRQGVGVEVFPLQPDLVTLDRRSAARAGPRRLLHYLRFTMALARRIRRIRPDVVHTASLKADLLGTLAAVLARRPVVWYLHDRISPDYLPRTLVHLVRAMARVPAAVIANSRATAATVPVPATVAYPGFALDQVGARCVQYPDPPVVGMIGRLSPTKGQLELVRAAPAILRRHPRASFRIVGGAMFGAERYAEEVRAEAHRLGVGQAFTFVGFTDDVQAQIDRCAVVVHASPVPEPFGQVVVEAMVRGVPVVATRAGGVTEIVHPGGEELGVLVPPGDPAGLATGINRILDDPQVAADRAVRARQAALERFDVTDTARIVTAVWQRVARG